jgi:hypothetical protein
MFRSTVIALTDVYLGLVDDSFLNTKVKAYIKRKSRMRCEILEKNIFQSFSLESIQQLSLCM